MRVETITGRSTLDINASGAQHIKGALFSSQSLLNGIYYMHMIYISCMVATQYTYDLVPRIGIRVIDMPLYMFDGGREERREVCQCIQIMHCSGEMFLCSKFVEQKSVWCSKSR